MRSLLLFILISAGIVSSQILFTPGNEHVYTYSGKVLAGIPQLDNTLAGLAITGKVMVQATGQNIFKLALVAALKVKLPFQQAKDIPYFWAAMEQGIEGVCENTYQVTELPEYLIYEHEPGMLKPEFCQGKKFFQVMKTRDITKCVDRAIFLSSKAHKNCLLGNCKGVNPKVSNTRYLGRGDNFENL